MRSRRRNLSSGWEMSAKKHKRGSVNSMKNLSKRCAMSSVRKTKKSKSWETNWLNLNQDTALKPRRCSMICTWNNSWSTLWRNRCWTTRAGSKWWKQQGTKPLKSSFSSLNLRDMSTTQRLTNYRTIIWTKIELWPRLLTRARDCKKT